MWASFLENILVCLMFVPITNPTPAGLEQCQWNLVQITPYIGVPCEAGPVFGKCGIQIGKKREAE